MKHQPAKRAVAIIAAALLATGGLAACAPSGKAPVLTVVGAAEDETPATDPTEDDDASEDDETAPPTSDTGLSASDIGRCFTESDLNTNSQAIVVKTKDCSEPHDSEVYFSYTSALTGTWSQTAIQGEASARCPVAADSYVDKETPDLDTLELNYVGPNQASWASGKREMFCYVRHGKLVEGSVKAS